MKVPTRLITGALEDFKSWVFAQELAVVIAHKTDRVTAARAVATAAIDIAAARLRAVNVSMEDVIEIVRQVYENRRER